MNMSKYTVILLFQGRPLCLFYFTHPFGVLSPEPPTITTAPPNIAQTFVNMEPVPPFWTSSSSQGYDTTSTRPSFDLGNTTVHRNPVNLVRNYGLDFRRDSISSSLFSSEMWFSSSASSRNFEGQRRIVPYNRTLPPLQLPAPRDLTLDFDSSDDVWTKKCVHREKFSLPPIEFPVSSVSEDLIDDKVSVSDSDYVKRGRRVLGVKKHKRKTQLSSIRRMLTRLMCRSIRGELTIYYIIFSYLYSDNPIEVFIAS